MELVTFLPLLIILGAFMFFASRRQKKAMQATVDLHESLKIDDRVHTTSGLEATVKGLTDDTVLLEIAPGVVTTWMKMAVRDRIDPDVDDEDDDDEDDDDDDVYVDEAEATSAVEASSDPDSVNRASGKTDS